MDADCFAPGHPEQGPMISRRALVGRAGVALAGAAAGVAHAWPSQVPVEIRAGPKPQLVRGADGRRRLAYELHMTNFYLTSKPLSLRGVEVFADAGPTLLAAFSAADLASRVRPAAGEDAKAPPAIGPGLRQLVFMWLSLPRAIAAPRRLRHRLAFASSDGTTSTVTFDVDIDIASPAALGPPLRGGAWLAYDGPGNATSHHWTSLVAIDGALTIPQRFAIDFYRLNGAGAAVRSGAADYRRTAADDWFGYGSEVIAVADGVVREAWGEAEDNVPFHDPPTPDDLTEHSLYGNFVVLQVASDTYVHYAHLRHGSVRVRVGEKVKRGAQLARLGVSGAAPAPHLHFQVSTKPTFKGSEGLPFTLDAFEVLAPSSLGVALDPARSYRPGRATAVARAMPLDGTVSRFA